MNSTLVINYNPFAMESQVYALIDGKQEMLCLHSKLDELADWLINYSQMYNIYNVKINAPYATTNELKKLVSERYSDNKINIEGM